MDRWKKSSTQNAMSMLISDLIFRWNVSDFSSCSKTCGGGIQTRSVSCIQEVRHGGNNILRVDESFCPQPPPITQQFCSVVDCPVKWKTGPWSKVINTLCLTGISLMFSIKSKIWQTSGGPEKFASNLNLDFSMKTELFWWEIQHICRKCWQNII